MPRGNKRRQLITEQGILSGGREKNKERREMPTQARKGQSNGISISEKAGTGEKKDLLVQNKEGKI